MHWTVKQQADHATVTIFQVPNHDLLIDLVALERSLMLQSIRSITLVFEPDSTIPMERLKRLNYQASQPRVYHKSISNQRSVRFSITEKCNYRCFFVMKKG